MVKKIAAFFCFVFIAASPAWGVQDSVQTFINAIVTAYNEDRFDDGAAFFHQDARIYWMGESKNRPQTVSSLLQRWRDENKQIADKRLGVKRVFPFENGLIVQYVLYGIPVPPVGAAAQPSKLSGREGVWYIHIENGKIREWREYTNPNLVRDFVSGKLPQSQLPEWPLASEIVVGPQEPGSMAAVVGYYQALNERNLEGAASFLADKAVFFNRTISSVNKLREVTETRLQNYFEEFKNRKVVIESMHVAGPYVVLRLFNYTDVLTLPSCDVVKVNNGKIQAVEEYFNISEVYAPKKIRIRTKGA